MKIRIPMRLLAFSDWRTQKIDDIFDFIETLIEPVDLILYGGDDIARFQNRGTNHFTELADYTKEKKVLAVVGNDDTSHVKSVLQSENVHDLHEEPFVLGDFGFMGLEASTSGPAIISHSEKYVVNHLKKQYEKIKIKNPIILSHTPPYRILDFGMRFAPKEQGYHNIGSKSLRNFIKTKYVPLVVCGHCHSQGGMTNQFHDTLIANVSSHDDFDAKGNFALIDIDSTFSVDLKWYDTFSMIAENSIRRIHELGPKRATHLERAKIKTIQDLAKLKNPERVSKKTRFSINFLKKLQLKARSVVENKVFQIAPLILPSQDLIFFDIETDTACKRVWLIGVLSNGKFTKFYAKNWKEEKSMLQNFLDFLRKKPNSVLVSYSGSGFDKVITHRALVRQNLDSNFFYSFPHVDLLMLIRRSLIFPNQSYALKELGSHLAYPFSHPDLGGLWIALEYQMHLKEKRKLDSRVFPYNKDDVNALPYIIDKISSEGYQILKEPLKKSYHS